MASDEDLTIRITIRPLTEAELKRWHVEMEAAVRRARAGRPAEPFATTSTDRALLRKMGIRA